MRALVGEALAAGAVGFATSKSPTHVGWAGRPVPSRLAELDELRALAGALGDAGAGVLQATLGRGLLFDELGQIAAETGRPVSWTALLAGAGGPGSHRGALERALRQQQAGQRVIPQVSCRPLNFEFQWKEPFPFESMKLFAPISTADLAGKLRIYRDPEFRRVFRESTDTGFGRALAAWWERTWIASVPTEPGLAERPLAEVARERGLHPLDLVLDLGIASRPRGALPGRDHERRRGRGGRAAARAAHRARPLGRRRPRQPALRRLLLDAPARTLGAREGHARARAGGAHAHRASRRGLRAHGPRAPRRGLARRRRRLRRGARGREPAAPGLRPAGRRRSPGLATASGSTR